MTAEQQRLVKSGLKLAESYARYFHWKWPEVPFEEFLSEGQDGLAQAAEAYDQQRGEFLKFAVIRIRGAMRDRTIREKRQRSLATPALDREEAACVAVSVDLSDAHNDTDESATARAVQGGHRAATRMLVAYLSDLETNAEQALSLRQEYRRSILALQQELAELAPEEERILDLRMWKGYSQRRAAEELGVCQRTEQRYEDQLLDKLRRRLIARGVAQAPILDGVHQDELNDSVRSILCP